VTSTTARDRAYVGFQAVYHRPLLEQWPDQDTAADAEDRARCLLDLDTLRFRAVDKSGGVAAVRGTV
jgi:hypothetical protein